jgi:uncharacterized protein (TIGR03086 family)
MDLLDAHGVAMGEFDRRVRLVADDQWGNPTPDSEWSVRDLVEHLVGEQLWVPLLLGGATVEEVGDRFAGDNLGADPKTAWSLAITAARNAWLAPGATDRTVHLSFGDRPATEYGWQMTTDLAVHAWDLARGIGADEDLPAELCQAVLEFVGPQADSWRDFGVFAAAVPVPADADIQTRLLGLLGRRR